MTVCGRSSACWPAGRSARTRDRSRSGRVVLPLLRLGGGGLSAQHPPLDQPGHLLDALAEPDRHIVDDLDRAARPAAVPSGVLVEELRGDPPGLQQDVVLAREVQVERRLGDSRASAISSAVGSVDAGAVSALGPQFEGGPDDGLPGVAVTVPGRAANACPFRSRWLVHFCSACVRTLAAGSTPMSLARLPPMIAAARRHGQDVQLIDPGDRVEHALRVRVVRAEDDVVGADRLDQVRARSPRGTGGRRWPASA